MGKFIVIDGLDGSGKGTITRMLGDELQKNNMHSRVISFPVYGDKSAELLEMYLSGGFGSSPDDTNAYAASTFFAVNRYASYMTDWRHFLDDSDAVLVADRYTSANAVHQLSKLKNSEWDAFLEWLFDFEYNKLGIAVPDTVIFLEMRPDIARKMVARRHNETGRSVDIHETDSDYLDRCYEAGLYASKALNWKIVKSYSGDEPRPLGDVLADVIEASGLMLPSHTNNGRKD